MNSIKLLSDAFNEALKKLNDFNVNTINLLEKEMIENAVPKLKYLLTKRKLSVRKIRLIRTYNGYIWIEQNGKPITKSYYNAANIKFDYFK